MNTERSGRGTNATGKVGDLDNDRRLDSLKKEYSFPSSRGGGFAPGHRARRVPYRSRRRGNVLGKGRGAPIRKRNLNSGKGPSQSPSDGKGVDPLKGEKGGRDLFNATGSVALLLTQESLRHLCHGWEARETRRRREGTL